MHPKYEKALRLREFKARQLAKIVETKTKLVQKYPNKLDRVMEIINKLIVATETLKTFFLPDYISLIYRMAIEFPELEALIPSHEDVKRLTG